MTTQQKKVSLTKGDKTYRYTYDIVNVILKPKLSQQVREYAKTHEISICQTIRLALIDFFAKKETK